MDSELRNKINELAEYVLDIYEIEIPIKNIEPLIKKLGGKIVYEDLGYKDSVIIKTGNESFLIKVNKKESFNINNRINALIAYELGHLILHMGYQRDRELWNKIETNQTIKTDFDENTEAWEFAGALLMPRSKYIESIEKNTDKNNHVNIKKVASDFCVDIGHAHHRGNVMGFFRF